MLSSLTVADGGGGGVDVGNDDAVFDINHPSDGEAKREREGGRARCCTAMTANTLHTWYIHAQCPVQPDDRPLRRRRHTVKLVYSAIQSFGHEVVS